MSACLSYFYHTFHGVENTNFWLVDTYLYKKKIIIIVLGDEQQTFDGVIIPTFYLYIMAQQGI